MSENASQEASQGVASSPDDLARMLAASGFGRSTRTKIIAAVLIAGIGVGASALSCVGQTFTLRQARALEGIERQLQGLQQQLGKLQPSICQKVER